MIAVNLTGTFLVCRAVIPSLLETAGVITNVVSTAGVIGQPYSAAYCASKGGVALLTKALAVEYMGRGIRVNGVAPGGVDTPIIWNFMPPEGADPKLIDRIMTPMGFCSPAEVAGAMAFLSSDEAAYISGAILSIDGASPPEDVGRGPRAGRPCARLDRCPLPRACPRHRSDGRPGRPASGVALDATALLGRPTGVGAFCAGALGGLAPAARALGAGLRRQLAPAARHRGARPRRGVDRAAGHGGPPAPGWPGPTPRCPRSRRSSAPLDVVHGTNFVVPPARRAARVATVHDLTMVRYPELCDRPTLAYPALIRRALRHGAWVHTPSAFVAAEVVEHFGADPERVRAVHSGCLSSPPARPSATREVDRPPPPAGHRALRAGRRDGRAPQGPPGAGAGLRRAGRLAAGGDPGAGRARGVGERRAGQRHRSVGLRGAGGAHRVAGRRRALVVAAPGGPLGLPLALRGVRLPPLQAMAAGVPVVATTAGALPEVLDDAAELVGPGDHEALAGALARVLDSAPVRDGLVARGRLRAAGFTWDRCAEGLAAVYRDARADRGAR